MNVTVETQCGNLSVFFVKRKCSHFFGRFTPFNRQSFKIFDHCCVTSIVQFPQGHRRVSRPRDQEAIVEPFQVKHPIFVSPLLYCDVRKNSISRRRKIFLPLLWPMDQMSVKNKRQCHWCFLPLWPKQTVKG